MIVFSALGCALTKPFINVLNKADPLFVKLLNGPVLASELGKKSLIFCILPFTAPIALLKEPFMPVVIALLIPSTIVLALLTNTDNNSVIAQTAKRVAAVIPLPMAFATELPTVVTVPIAFVTPATSIFIMPEPSAVTNAQTALNPLEIKVTTCGPISAQFPETIAPIMLPINCPTEIRIFPKKLGIAIATPPNPDKTLSKKD